MQVVGVVDNIRFPNMLSGWAYSPQSPSQQIKIEVVRDGTPISATAIWGHPREFLHINGGAIGFSVELDEPIHPSDVFSSDFKVIASSSQGDVEIDIWDECRSFLDTVEAISKGFLPLGFTEKRFFEVVKWLKRSNLVMPSNWYDTLLSSMNFDKRESFDAVPDHSKVSRITVPAGIESPDGTAKILPNGHAILISRSTPYEAAIEANNGSEENWVCLINDRLHRCKPAKFLQIIFPEKSTFLSYAPPSRTYQNVNSALQGKGHFIGMADLLQNNAEFRKMDTHLSAVGCWNVAKLIYQRLGFTLDEEPTFDKETFAIGDLSTRFFSSPVYDNYLMARDYFREPLLAGRRDPNRAGRHIGMRRHWKNDAAPFSCRIVISGNSFFGEGDAQTQANWWMSRLFSEVIFDFNPALDIDLLECFEPDAVICQTIERFMSALPPT